MPIYVLKDNQQTGPYDDADIRKGLSSGTLTFNDFVWSEGMTDWQPLSTLYPQPPSIPLPQPPEHNHSKNSFSMSFQKKESQEYILSHLPNYLLKHGSTIQGIDVVSPNDQQLRFSASDLEHLQKVKELTIRLYTQDFPAKEFEFYLLNAECPQCGSQNVIPHLYPDPSEPTGFGSKLMRAFLWLGFGGVIALIFPFVLLVLPFVIIWESCKTPKMLTGARCIGCGAEWRVWL